MQIQLDCLVDTEIILLTKIPKIQTQLDPERETQMIDITLTLFNKNKNYHHFQTLLCWEVPQLQGLHLNLLVKKIVESISTPQIRTRWLLIPPLVNNNKLLVGD